MVPPLQGGNRHLVTVPPGLGGNRRPLGGDGHGGGKVQGTFPKGKGFPKICLRLPSLLPRRQNHHPRVLPKAF